jgi:hypothetical protein
MLSKTLRASLPPSPALCLFAEYAARNKPVTQPLAAGTYVVGNEHQNDEDLCMLPDGATAMLMVVSGMSSIATAMSGR